MKVINLLLSIFITTICQGQDWEKIFPAEDYSNSIYHLVNPENTDVIYSFGNEMLVSTDQGNSWTKNDAYSAPVMFEWPVASVSSPNPFVDLEFPEVTTGFISDHERIWKTTDAGANWQMIYQFSPLNSGFNSSAYLENIQFLDAQKGFAVGPFERIMKTRDGGSSWELLHSSASTTPYFHLKDVHFFDQQHGIVAGYEIDNIYLNIGIYNHYLLITNDGGQTWQKTIPCPASDHQESSLYFIDKQRGYLLLSNQNYLFPLDLLFKTVDGGQTWKQLNIPAMVARKMYWYNQLEGVVIGGSGFLAGENLVARTTDGGVSWQQVYLTGNNGFSANRCFDVLFTDAQHGLIAGTGASLARTLDGGETWQTIKDVSWPFTTMDFAASTGFAIDASGAIFKTSDGVQ